MTYSTQDDYVSGGNLVDELFTDVAGTPDWSGVTFSNFNNNLLSQGILTIGSTGGTFGLKWSQHLTSATAVSLVSGSYILLTRLA